MIVAGLQLNENFAEFHQIKSLKYHIDNFVLIY